MVDIGPHEAKNEKKNSLDKSRYADTGQVTVLTLMQKGDMTMEKIEKAKKVNELNLQAI